MKRNKRMLRATGLLILGILLSHTVYAEPGEVALEDYGRLVTLEHAISKTLKDHAKVKQAFERLEKEKALYQGAKAEFLPKFGTQFFGAVATGDKRTVSYFDTFLEQPLFEGGKSVFNKQKQKVRVESESLKLEEAKLDLGLYVRILYAEVLKEKELTRIAQGEVKELSQAYERTNVLFQKEIIPRYDLIRIETLFEKAKAALVKHKESYDYQLSVLMQTIGVDAQESLELELLGEIPGLMTDISAYLALSRKHDPLYKLSGLQIQEKEFEKKMLQAERWPSVSLAAKWNVYQDVFVDTDRVMVGALGKWNIWDFGRLGSQINAKAHEIQETKWAGTVEIQEKENETRRLYHEARTASEKIRLQDALLKERDEGYKNEKTRLIAGEKGTGELLDSFLALEEAKMERLQAITEYRILLARLQRNMGFEEGEGS